MILDILKNSSTTGFCLDLDNTPGRREGRCYVFPPFYIYRKVKQETLSDMLEVMSLVSGRFRPVYTTSFLPHLPPYMKKHVSIAILIEEGSKMNKYYTINLYLNFI